MKVAIVGAGGHGQVVADALRTAATPRQARLVGYFDDDPRLAAGRINGVAVLGPVAALTSAYAEAAVIAIGDNRQRKKLFEHFARIGVVPFTVRHPHTTVASGVSIGPGSMLLAGAVVNTGAMVGCNVILNTASSIDHHAIVADHTHVAPGVRIGGNVTIGEGALIGIGAVLLPGVTVGPW